MLDIFSVFVLSQKRVHIKYISSAIASIRQTEALASVIFSFSQ